MTTTIKRNTSSRRGVRTEPKLDFRLSREAKEKIEKAALASGLSTSDFVASTLLREADDVLTLQTITRLSDRDRDMFLDLMENPPAPSQDVLEAVKEYRHRTQQARAQSATDDSDCKQPGLSPT